ncbi:nuclear protein Es2-domain-containing protein [Fimicolochytrium jonesii]|uniref:nuclear protein Es2-domain-containing protein n=1 Tax=Fimicolochytrium jonesii TaxID=1396493 RepID=UPI0022FE8530|nr:nuclear protein Es2-domain-containing protein [Fimicolochytrium jonesii]KAI8824347.1 nuclear protein Es2-domain-containing protein [Fimicolochytrium jonesii]
MSNEQTVASTATASQAVVSLTPNGQKRPRPKEPTVLEEDVYVQAVSDIIERDFFPNLKKMKLQNEFLAAVQGGEIGLARSLGVEMARMATSGRTPASMAGSFTPQAPFHTPVGSRTPVSVRSNVSQAATATHEGPINMNTRLSLDKFQAAYTSEDNASFATIVEKANKEQREKHRWIYEKEKAQLLLGTGPAPTDKNGKLIEGGNKGVEDWKFKARNALMYYPEGAPYTPADQVASRGAPKAVSHASTRFDPSLTNGQLTDVASATAERMRTQEVWRDMARATPGLLPRVEQSAEVQGAVDGYAYVSSTPALNPDEDIDPSELMTWGFIEGTPLLVDAGADHSGGRSFKIPNTPKREALGHKLSEKAAKSLRSKKAETGVSSPRFKTPGLPARLMTPGSSTPGARRNTHVSASPLNIRSASLSPGAQHLLKKTGAASFLTNNKSFDAQLRASYSKTPISSRTPGSVSNSRAASVAPFTPDSRQRTTAPPLYTPEVRTRTRSPTMSPPPAQQESEVKEGKVNGNASITDNLLQL